MFLMDNTILTVCQREFLWVTQPRYLSFVGIRKPSLGWVKQLIYSTHDLSYPPTKKGILLGLTAAIQRVVCPVIIFF